MAEIRRARSVAGSAFDPRRILMPHSTQPTASNPAPSFAQASVREAMHPGILTSTPEASLVEVARTMAAHRVHCVAVLGIDEGPRLVWGIVSDLDLIRASQAVEGEAPTAGQIAATEPVTVDVNEPLTRAAQVMAEHDVHHLVVVDGADPRPIGIVSCLDLATALAAE
jgi:CBS domain-containing protein